MGFLPKIFHCTIAMQAGLPFQCEMKIFLNSKYMQVTMSRKLVVSSVRLKMKGFWNVMLASIKVNISVDYILNIFSITHIFIDIQVNPGKQLLCAMRFRTRILKWREGNGVSRCYFSAMHTVLEFSFFPIYIFYISVIQISIFIIILIAKTY